MHKRILSALIAAALLASGAPQLAFAQQLEEIIVTSQRRAEDLQSVPIAVTAFTAGELSRLGVSDPQAMADFVPNVSIGDGTGRANVGAQFSIRGINEARISPVLDPAVGIYIDDVYYGRPLTNFLRLLDVQAVEVLRGPQGTLFGKNSTGGAIRYETVKPDIDAGTTGYVKLGLGQYDRVDARAAVNLSLSDTVAARFSMARLERDGYLDRLSDGVALGADNTEFYSAKLRFQPSDDLTVDLGLDYTESTSNGGASKLIDYFGYNGGYNNPAVAGVQGDSTPPIFTGGISNQAAYQTLFPVGTPENYAPVLPASLYEVAGTGPIGSTSAESTGITLDINYNLNDNLSLRSITGYRTVETTENRESDESAFSESFFDGVTVDDISFWSQEFQLNGSAFDGFLNYVTGVYYSVEEPHQSQKSMKDYRAVESFGMVESLRQAQQETTSKGIYFQADWALTDTLTLTTGVRYTEDEKNYTVFDNSVFDTALYNRLLELWGPTGSIIPNRDFDRRGGPNVITIQSAAGFATNGACSQTIPCAGAAVSGGDTFTATTPRIALEWQATDNAMFYVASSKGYKAGGTNDSVADINTPFQPEEVVSNELGARLTLLDGRLRTNITYFDMDYTDKQLTVTTSPICARRCTTNVGDASISGLEIEAVALLTNNLRLNLGYGSLDAKWSDIQNATAGVETDSPFSRAPDTSLTLGLQHTFGMDNGASLVSSVNYATKSAQQSSGQDSTTLTIPEYEIFTARITYEPADGNWQASLFCTNCLDEEYITGGAAWAGSTDGSGFDYKPSSHPAYVGTKVLNPAGNAPPGITLVNIGAPRMLGVDFTYNF
jgi:iron complex outermembrane recepter protein